jgi:hypothetical protein
MVLNYLQSGNKSAHYTQIIKAVNDIINVINSYIYDDDHHIATVPPLKSGNRTPHYNALVDKVNEIITLINEETDETVTPLQTSVSGNRFQHRDLLVHKINEIIALGDSVYSIVEDE